MNVIITTELMKKCKKVYTYKAVEAYSITELEMCLNSTEPVIHIKKTGNNQASTIALKENLGGGRLKTVTSVMVDGIEVFKNNIDKEWLSHGEIR